MANLLGFNANDHEPTGDFSPIPDGEYVAFIVASEMKATKDTTGEYLELVLQVAEGEYAGRIFWDRLNLVNKSEKAVQIAKGTLSAICRAVGHMEPKDSAELHALPMKVKVTVEEWGDDGQTSNRVKSYKAVNGTATATEPTRPTLSQASAPTTTKPKDNKGLPPWGKGKPPF